MRLQKLLKFMLILIWTQLLVLGSISASPAANNALDFDGANDYVTFGQATAELGQSTFTIECWFKREGIGATTSTGTGGVIAVPLVSKGRGEADGDNRDMNYFLGIGSGNVLAADFEDTATGGNHPVTGVTPISTGNWYHAAVTYDGTTWRIYLNGQLDNQLAVSATPRSDSVQHAGIATAMTSTGAAAGFFDGLIDEIRIWDHARTQTEIQDNLGVEITAASGLVGRWGLNEGSGVIAGNSVSGGVNGTLMNGPLWVGGSPFSVPLQATFQEGVNGYAGTYDTFLAEGLPDTSHGTLDEFAWDSFSEAWGNAPVYGLLRFENIFGPGMNQVPQGAIIHSASLFYVVSNAGDAATVNEAAADWDEDETWNSFGFIPGVQPEDYGPQVAMASGDALSTFPIDVSSSLEAWAFDPTSNKGWIFRPTGTDGVRSRSREYATIGERPLLVVNYSNPPTSAPDAPTDLSIDTLTFAHIGISWTDNADNEANFEIERSTTGMGGPFDLLATVRVNTTAFIDQAVLPDMEYCYRVRATNIIGGSAYTDVVCVTTPVETNTAVDFGVNNAYVTFGAAPELGSATFTIECWFKREGTGVTVSTGGGGTLAVPLVTKGRGEDDGNNKDMNYFLGIRDSDNVLAADFEDTASGGNHPVAGVTPISNGIWYHAAVTYDGTTWRLYLNGLLETEVTEGATPRADSIQHAGLGTAMTSDGTPEGYFDGVIDEVRVWNYARTLGQIRSTINSEIAGSQSGLLARWSLNEGSGTMVSSSAGTVINGNIMNSGWSWVTGAPFDLNINLPPNQPTLESPASGAVDVDLSPTLEVTVSDPEADSMTVTFYGRNIGAGAGEDFTIIALPDTQFYSQLYPATFIAQTQWIVDNIDTLNIVFVTQLGDCVQNGDNSGDPVEWERADTAMSVLEDPSETLRPEGIPFGVAVGNHDQSPIGDADGTTTFFNQFFGELRFTGGTDPGGLMTQILPGVNRSYYGGHYGLNNDNHYELFSGGGMDFIIIHLEYDTSPDQIILDWADGLLTAYSNRRAIVVTHHMIRTGNPGTFSTQGLAIFSALKDHANLFLLLGGHVPGEGRRTTDTGDSGNPIYSLLADYQSRSNGGNGWLRILEFSPANNEIRVKTYSPTLDQFETDSDSQFTLSYDMQGAGFEVIGTNTGVSSGSNTGVEWSDLVPLSPFEWYVTVSDGESEISGPVWSFTTTGIIGDLDGDCDVDGSDLALLISEYPCVSGCTYDLTGDGAVDENDLDEFALHYGEVCP